MIAVFVAYVFGFRFAAKDSLSSIGFVFVLACIIIIPGSIFLPLRDKWLIDTLMTVCFLLFIFVLVFFRNPERKIDANPRNVLSPADGKVVEVKDSVTSKFLPGKFKQVSIFMNLHNVHIQRMPLAGEILSIEHVRGRFLPAFNQKSGKENDQKVYVIRGNDFDFIVKQIAGVLVQKTISWIKPGDKLKQGERFGMIRFSSRVEIFLPRNVEIDVAPGSIVRAGLDVIGFLGKEEIKKKK